MSNQFVSTPIRVAGADAAPLSESDPFELSCGTAGCSANCCKNGPPIVLNPYEISMICREGRLSYEDLLDIVETGRTDGFPLIMLPRDPECRFWTGKGCGIYPARPLACRLFPLGRVFHAGRSHLVLHGRNVCAGISSSPLKTVGDYLAGHETRTCVSMADRWIEFVSEMEQMSLPDRSVTSVAFHMLVYSPDTPAAAGVSREDMSLEERFLLRLATAREQLPRFLSCAPKNRHSLCNPLP